ncbi:MAG: FliM/FliN family flagellar motor switch protein [Pseudomonadota bacterium]
MLKGGHETLRRKVAEAKGARPPLRDVAYVGDMFARLLEERLMSTLRQPVSVVYKNNGKTTFGDAVEGAAQPSVLAFAKLPGDVFGGLLPLDAPFIFHLIEVMTGVDRTAKSIPDRSLTPIDEALSEDFAGHVFSCFEAAVAPRGDRGSRGALRFERFRRTIGLGVGAPEGADMLSLDVAVALGAEAEPRDLTLFVPYYVFDFYRGERRTAPPPPPAIRPDHASPETVWTTAMARAAKNAELRLVAVLSQMKLSVEEISAMRPGVVVALPDDVEMTVDLRLDQIGGVAEEPQLCFGALGAASGKRAVKIDEPPDEEFLARVTPYVQS